MSFDLCKFGVFCLFVKSFLFISNVDALNRTRSSAEIFEKFKIKNVKAKSNVNLNEIQNNSEYIDVPELDLNSGPNLIDHILLKENEETSCVNPTKVNSNEIKVIYWCYDRVSAIYLGIFFGLALDLNSAKAFITEPTGLLIAIFCKFILSPFVSFVYSHSLTEYLSISYTKWFYCFFWLGS